LAHKGGPPAEEETSEKPVWREYQPDLYTDKDSVMENVPQTAFHDLEESDAF